MIAYDKIYLEDAQETMGEMFEYMVQDCGIDIDYAFSLFTNSKYAKLFQEGNPYVLTDISGVELANKVLLASSHEELINSNFSDDIIETPEYWIGRMLAYYQWKSARKFIMICHDFKPSFLYEFVKNYQNETETKVYSLICKIIEKNCEIKTKLRMRREGLGLSQSKLASASGVNIRSIQLYEQRKNSIDKAQADILYKLSVVLKCSIEDLLEKPEI